MEEMDIFEAMYSLRSFTRFKPDPVPKEAIDKIIDAAIRAPNGGNTQPWEFIAITDPQIIAQVGAVYKDVWLGNFGPEAPPDEPPAYKTARYLANHMPEVPAMILMCVVHPNSGQAESFVPGSRASSIWPAAQNLFLAARALGLGTRLTTAHLRGEQKIKDILGIPDHVETVMLTPLGYPRGNFGPTQRRPAGEVTSYNRYGNRG